MSLNVIALGCGPSSSVANFEQTLFLGCTIKDVHAEAGWEQQGSSFTVTLVQDTCAGNSRAYYDANLQKQYTASADPGFLGESYDIIGMPVYFRIADWEHSGIIQSWTYTHSPNGKIYTVVVTSPTSLLAGAQLITGGCADSVPAGMFNIFNVYGFLESTNSVLLCAQTSLKQLTGADKFPSADKYINGDWYPDGSVLGSPAYYFGGSEINPNGMPWYYIKGAFNILSNAYPKQVNGYSRFGRYIYRGFSPVTANYGLVAWDNASGYSEYFIDLSELPNGVYNSGGSLYYWRVAGDSVNLLDAITQLCEAAQLSFYTDLIFVDDSTLAPISGIAKVIKVRTIDRSAQPAFGDIASYLGYSTEHVQISSGKELKNDPSSKMIIGGNKETLYQLENTSDSYIYPYIGLDESKNTIIPTKTDSGWTFEVPTTRLQATLRTLSVPDTVTITENELLAAKEGFDSWKTMAVMLQTDLGTIFDTSNIKPLFEVANFASENGFDALLDVDDEGRPPQPVQELLNTAESDEYQEEAELDMQAIYDWISGYANNFGTKFQVSVPYTCIKKDGESGAIIQTEYPSQDGWTEQAYILGAKNPGVIPEFFRDESNNKISAFCRFDYAPGLQNGGYKEFDYIIGSQASDGTRNDLFVPVSVESDFAFTNYNLHTGPYAVFSLNHTLHDKSEFDYVDNFGLIAKVLKEYARVYNTLVTSLTFYALLENAYREARAHYEIHEDYDNISFTTDKEWVQDLAIVCHKWDRYYSAAYEHFEDNNIEFPDWINNYNMFSETFWAGDIQVNNMPPLLKFFAQGYCKLLSGKLTNLDMYPEFRVPDGVALGLRSTVQTYGPWGVAGTFGPVTVETNADLVPWNYNGYTRMHAAATSLVNSNRSLMNLSERGTIEIAGYPTVPLGAEIGATYGGYFAGENLFENRYATAYTYFGYPCYGFSLQGGRWLGNYGPNISHVEVRISPDGVTTTYNMQTYTPRFGEMNKLNADRLADRGRTERKIQRRILQKQFRDTQLARAPSPKNSTNIQRSRNSPHIIFAAETLQNNGQAKTTVESLRVDELSVEEFNYKLKATMGMEAFFRPVSIGSGVTGFSAFTMGDGVLSQAGMPPINDYYNLNKGSKYQNPYSNPAGYDFDDIAAYCPVGYSGHDMSLLAQTAALNQTPYSYSNDYRVLALKGPVIISQWGYDTDGKPVPNSGDYTDYFESGFLQNPSGWKTGPLDVRWDDTRKVWTFPQLSFLTGVITGATGENVNCNISEYTLYDDVGDTSTDENFSAISAFGNLLIPGSPFYSIYDSLTQQHVAHGIPRQGCVAKATMDISGFADPVIYTGTLELMKYNDGFVNVLNDGDPVVITGYNLSSSINNGDHVFVKQDSFNTWYIAGGGGGESSDVCEIVYGATTGSGLHGTTTIPIDVTNDIQYGDTTYAGSVIEASNMFYWGFVSGAPVIAFRSVDGGSWYGLVRPKFEEC